MDVEERVNEYIRETVKVPVLRGDDALALARAGDYIVTGRAGLAGVRSNGKTYHTGEVLTLAEDELTQYALFIKVGALVDAAHFRAYDAYHTRQGYITKHIEPAQRDYFRAVREVEKCNNLIIAAQAQLEKARAELERAQAQHAQVEVRLADVIDNAPNSS